jgi:hypothetical protein
MQKRLRTFFVLRRGQGDETESPRLDLTDRRRVATGQQAVAFFTSRGDAERFRDDSFPDFDVHQVSPAELRDWLLRWLLRGVDKVLVNPGSEEGRMRGGEIEDCLASLTKQMEP